MNAKTIKNLGCRAKISAGHLKMTVFFLQQRFLAECMLQGEESVAKLENGSSGTKNLAKFLMLNVFSFLWKVGILFAKNHPKTRCSFTPTFCPRSESEKYATTSTHLKSWRKQGKKEPIKSSCRQLNKMFGWSRLSMGISTLTYPVHLGPRKIPSQKVAYSCCLFNTPPETNSSPLNIGHSKRKLFFQPFSFQGGYI